MNKKEVKAEIEQLLTLQAMTRSYAELSSERMKKVRSSVVSARDFIISLDVVFQEVRKAYRRQILVLSKKKKGGKVTFLAHNGKTVAVLLSANTGLYGGIVKRTFDLFAKEVADGKSEAAIVGRLGRSLFLQNWPDRAYSFFEFPDHGFTRRDLAALIAHLVAYEEIHIYYGKFASIVNQTPEMFNIKAETPVSDLEFKEKVYTKYLFEPTIEQILAFFETEMFTSTFEQTVNESQLAKFASRMIAMDVAYENIGKKLTTTKIMALRVAHDILGRKQLNLISSMTKWRKF